MRTPTRIATTAIALAAVFPIGIGPAHAETAVETATNAAYFSRATPEKPDALPADPAPYFNRLESDRVAPNHLAVAVTVPNQSDKESFVAFELASILGLTVENTVTVTKAVMTAPLQPDDDKNRSANHTPDKVKACAAGTEGFFDADAGAYDEKPSVDCKKLEAVAKASADAKAYEFDVTPLAQTWVDDVNDGIALVPAKTDQPFQVVFQPGSTFTLAVEYTATPLDDGGETIVDPVPSFAPLPPVPGYVPPPNTGVTPTVTTPTTAPQPVPSVAPRPTVAPRAQASRGATVPAGFREVNSLNALFWLAAIVGVFVIGAISLFLGSPEVPVSSGARQNGVGRALDERRRVAGRPGVRPTARSVRPA